MKRALAHASPSHVTTQIEAFGQMKGSLNRAVVALRTRSISGITSPWLHTTAASFSLRSSSASARASTPSAWRTTYSLMGAAPAAGRGEGGAAPHDDARPDRDGSSPGGERPQVVEN